MTNACQTHHVHFVLSVFALRIFLDLKPAIRFMFLSYQAIGWKYSCLPFDKLQSVQS